MSRALLFLLLIAGCASGVEQAQCQCQKPEFELQACTITGCWPKEEEYE